VRTGRAPPLTGSAGLRSHRMMANHAECRGQLQFAGWRPTILPVLLLVLHNFSRRARKRATTHLSANSGLCSSRWAALLFSSRLHRSSFSLSRSLWWTPNPSGIGPFACSQINCALSTHTLGSATLIKARFSPFRLCRVRMRTVPTGNLLPAAWPFSNLPSNVLISDILPDNYACGNCWSTK
jgi:hypothetical protein